MNLPLDLALRVTGAALSDAPLAPPTVRANTDTRALERGDTYVALRGERFDGHDFVAEAVRRGAAMLVVDKAQARVAGVPAMLVADTLGAYMAMAAAARELFRGLVVAITGSAGKTTTKTFLARLLGDAYGGRVLAAPANENNEIGVSRLLLRASNEAHDVLVVEMGARHFGDVAALVEVARPHVGILTNVGDAHLEIVGSRDRLAQTKWGLFARGARAILNAFDDQSRGRASTLAERPHWFSAGARLPQFDAGSNARLTSFLGERVLVDADGERISEREVSVGFPGEHNRANLAAAISGALELGVPLESLVETIPRLQLPQGRYDAIELAGGLRVIYDAYNANASATIAALDTFAQERASRRIAVLAGMAELGDESRALHERVGAHAAGRVDVLLVYGEHATAFARGARSAGLAPGQIVPVSSNTQAAAWLREHARADDVVLLKGSRKYRLEEIVEELRR